MDLSITEYTFSGGSFCHRIEFLWIFLSLNIYFLMDLSVTEQTLSGGSFCLIYYHDCHTNPIFKCENICKFADIELSTGCIFYYLCVTLTIVHCLNPLNITYDTPENNLATNIKLTRHYSL